MCSMDSAPCTPIHEMYVVSVPTRGLYVQRVVSASTEISDWILSREKLNLNKMGNAFEYNPPILYQSG